MNTCKRILAFALALIMILSYLPAQHIHVSATEEDTVTESTPTEAPTGESTEEPTEEPTDASAEESVENGITVDGSVLAEISEAGMIAYIPFTPSQTEGYTFQSVSPEHNDTYGYICDAEKNALSQDDDGGNLGNFSVTYTLQKDTLYYLGARYYDENRTGSIPVVLSVSHDYECTSVGNPTCVTPVEENYTCIYCGDHYSREIFGDHSWDEGTETVAASCTTPGSVVYACTTEGCDETRTEIIYVDHSFADGICGACGAEEALLNQFQYNILYGDNNTRFVEINYYNGSDAEIEIPAMLGGYPVKRLGNVFDGNQNITSVVIPEGVESLIHTFNCCENLTSVTLPSTLKTIDTRVFNNCYKLTSIELPQGLEKIGECAFEASGLESVVIPDSVTEMQSSAFSNCAALSAVSLSSGLTQLTPSVFWECNSLKSIVFPNSITVICANAFNGCSALENITFGSNLTTIGHSAFASCSALREVRIPDSVTSMESSAFAFCSALESVYIGNGISTINSCTFNDCSALELMVLGSGLTRIEDDAIINCDNLVHAFFLGTQEQWDNLYIGINNHNLTDSTVHCGTDGTDENGNSVLSYVDTCISTNLYCSLCQASVSEKLKETPTHIWGENDICTLCGHQEGVLQLDVPYTATISEPNGSVCVEFTIPYDESYFFKIETQNNLNCTLHFNNGDASYDVYAPEWTSCSAIYAQGDTVRLEFNYWDSEMTGSFRITPSVCHSMYGEQTKDPTCTEPGEMTLRCSYCDYSYTTIIEPSHSFENGQCTGCDEVQILEECFGYYENDDGTITISGYYGSFYDVTVPSQLDGKAVSALGYGAFSGSGQLKSVTIPEGITSLDEYCFAGCGALESVCFPSTLTTISGYAFENCHRLKQIDIPDSVTSLGYNLFLNCYDLETATIGSGVTVLPAGLFSSCNALETIYLGANITEIQSLAFANCYALHHIFFEGSEEDWSNIFIESEGNERLFNGYITVHCDTDGASVLSTREDCTSIYTDCSLCNAVVKQTPKDIPSHQMGEDGICTLCGHQEGVLQLDMPYTAFISQPGEVITLELSVPASESYSFKVETQETLRYTMKWNYNEQTDPCWPSEYNFGAIFNAGDVVQLQFSYQDSNMTGSFRITPYISHQMYGEQTKDPTCTEPGEMIHRCSYCDYSYTTVIEPSHSYENGVCTACGDQQILEDCFHYEDNGDGTVTIMDYSGSFYDVVIPSQLGGMPVVAINNYAMDYNSNLQSVTVPEGVTRLGYGAFYNCYNLETVNLPGTLTTMDGETFSRCYKLKNVNLPDSVTTMGYGVFYE
ncbi:MAG: leucine-rich repeat domain-containing protein, partial [Oscillospiraceae bacterium]|nr:leucine-rich repeat domain-containing protein [Oscillospiraceae bacterium]